MTVAPGSSVLAVGGRMPSVADSAFVAPGARVIGEVTLGESASVWYSAVVRGDSDRVVIGEGSNVQDGVAIHTDSGHATIVGRDVSIGHNAVVHGCTVEDACLIGMGSVVLSGAVIGTGSLVAAGAVVLEGTVVPPGSLVAGIPAKVRRTLTDAEREHILQNAVNYRALLAAHAEAES